MRFFHRLLNSHHSRCREFWLAHLRVCVSASRLALKAAASSHRKLCKIFFRWRRVTTNVLFRDSDDRLARMDDDSGSGVAMGFLQDESSSALSTSRGVLAAGDLRSAG